MRDLLSKLDEIAGFRNEDRAMTDHIQDFVDGGITDELEIRRRIQGMYGRRFDLRSFQQSLEIVKDRMQQSNSNLLQNAKEEYSVHETEDSESIFQIGDDFGISFREDFEIGTEIADILEDGILIDLDEHAIELLQKEGITFVDVDLTEAKKKGLDGKACRKGYRYAGTKMKGGRRVDNCVKVGEKQVPAGGTLREFAPYSGDGSGARWYNDDELADLLGDDWLQDLDVSSKLGDIELTKDMTGSADPAVAYLVDMAQRWLDAQGYHVRVLSARDNEDEGNLDWLIDGIFYRDLNRAKLQQAAQNEHDYYAKLYVNLLSQLEDTTWHDRAGAWLHARRSLDGGRISLDDFKKKIQAMELEVKKKKGLPESTLGTTDINEAEYQGRKVQLGKPMAGDVKKSKVYVRGPKGNVVKVNFGDKKMKIKKSNPKRRKSFRARHNCANPGPRWKARYWSCRAW